MKNENEETKIEQEYMDDESFDLEEFFQDLDSEENFIKQIDCTTKELLIKYDLLNSIFKAIRFPGMINLGISDYVEMLNEGTLCAYCNEVLTKDELPLIHDIANPKKSISIIFNILYPNNEDLSIVAKITNFFNEKYPSADIVYGVGYDNDLEEDKISILALIVTK